ncbi:hypothetical protein DPMN_004855 [Dreissena polymorpha]|uniref:Uncharacterized protein n=1 Tax=Dreissena polymorpha TaxID=45954 RepID=A0A9D4RW17_DREPO|nr:hypothetical protein DPMN_004855 [Dreissena polymorpha]
MIRNELIVRYFQEGLSYRQICDVLLKTHSVSISVCHIHWVLRPFGLKRRDYSDIRTVIDFILNELRGSGSLHGYRMLTQRCLAHGLRVRTSDNKRFFKYVIQKVSD